MSRLIDGGEWKYIAAFTWGDFKDKIDAVRTTGLVHLLHQASEMALCAKTSVRVFGSALLMPHTTRFIGPEQQNGKRLFSTVRLDMITVLIGWLSQ